MGSLTSERCFLAADTTKAISVGLVSFFQFWISFSKTGTSHLHARSGMSERDRCRRRCSGFHCTPGRHLSVRWYRGIYCESWVIETRPGQF